jgi:hypothetical protein
VRLQRAADRLVRGQVVAVGAEHDDDARSTRHEVAHRVERGVAQRPRLLDVADEGPGR